MIMQEFETRRNQTITQKTSVFDNVPILVPSRANRTQHQTVNSFSSTSSAPQVSSFDETPISVSNKKQQGPFPYLKRKSIRVDLVLKQQKQQAKKNSAKKSIKSKPKVSNNAVETLRKEKKSLQEENAILKGRLIQLEKMFHELIRKPSTKTVKNQECQTETKSTCTSSCQTETTPKKQTFSECSKCHKCVRSSYLKHHQRFCGNLKLNKLLSEKDLKRLQIIRKNSSSSSSSVAPKNNWRKTRQEFLNQLKKDKLKQACTFVALPKKRTNKF